MKNSGIFSLTSHERLFAGITLAGAILGEHAAQGPVIPRQQHQRQHDDLRLAQQSQAKQEGHDQVTQRACPAGFHGVPLVGSQGQEAEQRAQHGFAFRDPCDGFDIERMQRKQRRHHEAAAGVAGRALQDPEEQHGVDCMEQNVLVMRAGGIESEELNVDGVRHPGERMPIAGIPMRERPQHGPSRKAIFDVRILCDVLGIVDVGEGVVVHWRIDCDRHGEQQYAEDDRTEYRIARKEIGFGLNHRPGLNADRSHEK